LFRPIIILGAPRTGTTLLARILGLSEEVFLITEIAPRLKPRHCPEDQSGVSDSDLWRCHFTFRAWRTDRPRPICERPVFDHGKLESMRDRYLKMAGTKRLVIKNPLCLARADMLKTMFPNALFIFSLRAPWPTIQAAVVKGKSCYILPTEFVNRLPHDLVFRAAATWAESVDVLRRERDSSWFVVRHEELVARPYKIIAELYDRVELAKSPVMHAALLPEMRVRDYSFIKYQFMRHPYRAAIVSLLDHRAPALGYDPKPSKLPGSALLYAAEVWLNQLRQSKKQKRSAKREQLNRALIVPSPNFGRYATEASE
jgi:hypothetical protein